MEQTVLTFGTYNVPVNDNSLSASFTAPALATREMIEIIPVNNDQENYNQMEVITDISESKEASKKK